MTTAIFATIPEIMEVLRIELKTLDEIFDELHAPANDFHRNDAEMRLAEVWPRCRLLALALRCRAPGIETGMTIH